MEVQGLNLTLNGRVRVVLEEAVGGDSRGGGDAATGGGGGGTGGGGGIDLSSASAASAGRVAASALGPAPLGPAPPSPTSPSSDASSESSSLISPRSSSSALRRGPGSWAEASRASRLAATASRYLERRPTHSDR